MKNSGKPKISLIIPTYNVENYLNQTLFSAVNQTLKDIEIICIDDCSGDKSREIIKVFADTDPRIRWIFHETNTGVGISRKEAIRLSQGEYIMFLDGDDYLDVNACQSLYREISESSVDMLHFSTTVVPNGTVDENEINGLKQTLAPCVDVLRCKKGGVLVEYCFNQRKFGCSLWNKIYRGDIVRTAVEYFADERFNISEDLYLFFLIAFFSGSYKGIGEPYYFYNFGAGITGGKRSLTEKRFEDKVRQGTILRYLKEFAEEFDPAGVLKQSLNTIQDNFISDAVWNLIWEGDTLNRPRAIDRVFDNFDKAIVLTKLFEYYYNVDIKKKTTIVEICRGAQSFTCEKKQPKTVGTFYFRVDNGGVERSMAKVITIWAEQGYDVVLFTEDLPSAEDYEYPDSVKRVILPQITENTPQQYEQRITFLQDMLKRYNVDVMVYHAWFWERLALDMLATKSMGIPFVVQTHSFFGHGLKSGQATDAHHSIFINKLYGLCDAVVTLTKTDYNWWATQHPNVFQTLNPLTFELDSVKPAKLETKNILWVGRISWEKQPMDALKIMREIIDAGVDAKLQILGKADNEEFGQQFLNTIKELRLEDHVEVLGFHSDVSPYYKNASVYLCTSEYEGFLMTLAESKIYGIPTVTYLLPNLDMVQEGAGMKVVGQNRIRDAALEVATLLQDRQERVRMGKEARESVERMYSLDVAALWDQIFKSVTGKADAVAAGEVDLSQLKNAIGMLLDFTARGVALRDEERVFWRDQYHYAQQLQSQRTVIQQPAESDGTAPVVCIDAKELVLDLYSNGHIGFKYILRYIKAWLKYKLFRGLKEKV